MKASSWTADTFEENVLGYLDDLYSAARRLTRNAAYSEDLTHDAALRALKARHQFEPGTNLRAWLLRILTNTFITMYRRGGVEQSTLELSQVGDPITDQWISSATLRSMREPDEDAIRSELRSELMTALDELADDYRIVLLLADVEELSYREIAQTLDIPIGTVMSRLHRARRSMQTKLSHHAVEMGLAHDEDRSNNVIAMNDRRGT